MESIDQWLIRNDTWHQGANGTCRHTLARHMKHRPGLFCTGFCTDSGVDDSSAGLTVSSLSFSCSLSSWVVMAGKLSEGVGGEGVAAGCFSKLLLLIGVDDGAGLASEIAIDGPL